MSKKTEHQNPEEKVGEALNATERFLKNNKNTLTYTLIAILAVVAIGFSYSQFYRKPLKEEALTQSFIAEQHFRNDNFETALNGDGNILGFNQVIDEYGSAAPAIVHFYAGVCNLQLGNYSEAISALKRYKTKDPLLQARAIANIGDASAALGNNREALNYYLAAASHTENIFSASYLLKAAIMYEEIGDNESAIGLYKEIKLKYPQSQEGADADKYIARISVRQ